jgi:hypothetical protein
MNCTVDWSVEMQAFKVSVWVRPTVNQPPIVTIDFFLTRGEMLDFQEQLNMEVDGAFRDLHSK